MTRQEQLNQRYVKDAVFDAFRSTQNSPNGYTQLSYDVNQILRQRGFQEWEGVRDQDQATLYGRAEALLREVIWELVSQGVLVPGYNDNNPDWPFLSLTEYGRNVVEEGRTTPADPEGFIDRFREVYPQVRDDIILYVSEAVRSFNRRVYLGAVVMLGVAAEGIMYDLASAIQGSYRDDQRGQNWHRREIAHRLALQQHRAITNRLNNVQGDMPRQIRERLDTHLRGIYSLIRHHRNEAGHPTGVQKSRDDALPLFYLFISQAELISDLITWLGEIERF